VLDNLDSIPSCDQSHDAISQWTHRVGQRVVPALRLAPGVLRPAGADSASSTVVTSAAQSGARSPYRTPAPPSVVSSPHRPVIKPVIGILAPAAGVAAGAAWPVTGAARGPAGAVTVIVWTAGAVRVTLRTAERILVAAGRAGAGRVAVAVRAAAPAGAGGVTGIAGVLIRRAGPGSLIHLGGEPGDVVLPGTRLRGAEQDRVGGVPVRGGQPAGVPADHLAGRVRHPAALGQRRRDQRVGLDPAGPGPRARPRSPG
jgi:hypothetical protein